MAERAAPAARPPSSRVRAVLFDCLGTLLRLEPPAPRLRAELSARGAEVTEQEASAAFTAEIAYYLDHHLEGRDGEALERLRDDCARVVADALGLVPQRLDAVRDALLASIRFEAYPDVSPALAALRAAGLRLVVTSNWDCSLERVLSSAGLRQLLDGIVTSAEVGAAKPDAAVFRAALDLAASDPVEAVCVGDSLDRDVAGARAAGVEAILLDRSAGPSAGHVPVARSLEEARSLILARA